MFALLKKHEKTVIIIAMNVCNHYYNMPCYWYNCGPFGSGVENVYFYQPLSFAPLCPISSGCTQDDVMVLIFK
eukprot:UN10866